MPTPGYIALQFNATYLGDYRICWRVNTGSYSCFTMNCGSIGACTAYITPVSFPTDTCDTDSYNGYVQAACEDPNTLDGAVMWDIDYATIQACVPWEYSCLGTNVTNSSFNIDITGSGQLAFQTANILGNVAGRTCLCDSSGLGPPLLRLTNTWNTNLAISPWVSNDLTKVQAWDPVTQNSGDYHWTPGTIFCGLFQGCIQLASYNYQNDDPCVDYQTSNINLGAFCILKPIVLISPPSVGTQATAECVMGMGGLLPTAAITITNPGSGGTPNQTYYAWNIAATGVTNPCISMNNLGQKGRNYFRVQTGSTGAVTSITPCNNINCDPSQPAVYGYNFSGQIERIIFDPATIGNCVNVEGRTAGTFFDVDLGTILDVVITNPGSGYTSLPTVSIVSQNCSNALSGISTPQFTVSSSSTTGPCPSFVPNSACGTYPNNAYPTIPSMPIGTEFNICYPNNVTPPAAVGWDIQKDTDGCCYDCVTLSVGTTNANPNPKVVYTDCDGKIIRVETITSSPFAINCVVNDSWASDASDTTFQVIGPC